MEGLLSACKVAAGLLSPTLLEARPCAGIYFSMSDSHHICAIGDLGMDDFYPRGLYSRKIVQSHPPLGGRVLGAGYFGDPFALRVVYLRGASIESLCQHVTLGAGTATCERCCVVEGRNTSHHPPECYLVFRAVRLSVPVRPFS